MFFFVYLATVVMNQKKVTIQDIAERANVSKSTVSRVLNNSTPVAEEKRKAVLEATAGLNFKPNVFARSLAGGRSMTIGIITEDVGSPFYDSIMRGTVVGLNSTEFTGIIADGQRVAELEKLAIATIVERQVDGLILIGGSLDSDAIQKSSNGIPTVMVARTLPGWEDRSIVIDNAAACKLAAQHLIEMGHRNIVHIMGPPGKPDAIARVEGFKAAMKEANLECTDQQFVQGDFGCESGVKAVELLLEQGKPFTAICAANDQMAYGARLALFRKNIKVPDDVSIIGFDDQSFSAYMAPPLTTVSQPSDEMGEAAAKMLINILEGKPVEPIDIPVELVIRESVKRIGA